jgi:hypothetical protein
MWYPLDRASRMIDRYASREYERFKTSALR